MGTNFPASQDNFSNPTATSTLSSPSHSQQHSDVNDAVEAIEGALLDGAPLHIDDANERVGIGTAAPDYPFQVGDSSQHVSIVPTSHNALRIISDTSDGRPYISFYNQDDAGELVRKGYIGFPTNAQSLADSNFYINAGEGSSDLYISAGAVGINDSTPSYELDVNGDINATGDVRIGGTAIGEATSFTPTWTTGVTVGNGTVNAYYFVINEYVHVSVDFQLSTTSAITGDVRMELPVQASSTWHCSANVVGFAYDNSTAGYFQLMGRAFDSSAIRIRYVKQSGGSSQGVFADPLASTDPFNGVAWTSGDRLVFSTWYKKA